MSAVRRLAAGEAPALAAIVRGLPEYFTDDVPGKVEHDAASHEAWVITDGGTIAGFVIASRKSPGGAEILWIAVDAPRRGQGHGTRLLSNVMDDLAETGVSVVTVKTLDSSAGYAPYEATRAFYERNGFVYVDHDRPVARLAARQPRGDLRGRDPPYPRRAMTAAGSRRDPDTGGVRGQTGLGRRKTTRSATGRR